MVALVVGIVALAVVAAAVVVVFKMFLATQEAKFSSKEVGLLFAQLKDSLGLNLGGKRGNSIGV